MTSSPCHDSLPASSPGDAVLRVALIGNPNTGKTTLFNALTGSNQKVGNWPGVTVERKEGILKHDGRRALIVDLPGTYSLGAWSLDERIARDFLLGERPDVVLNIVDASNIERNLFLTVILLEMGFPVVVSLNMMDMAEKKGIRIKTHLLERALGATFIPTVASTGRGLAEITDAIFLCASRAESKPAPASSPDIEDALRPIMEEVAAREALRGWPPRWVAIGLVEKDPEILDLVSRCDPSGMIAGLAAAQASRYMEETALELESAIVERRYESIESLMKHTVQHVGKHKLYASPSEKADRIIINRFLGIPIFLLAMFLSFQLVFTIGTPLADGMDYLIGLLAKFAAGIMTRTGVPALVVSLVSDGIISGVGSVLVFLPHITILFILISILEDSGYMARAAFVMDRLMHVMGLHGKSFIPMLIGFGCNVPAFMGTRILRSRKDRILTNLVIPFMSCTARLPIYTLFAAAFFPNHRGLLLFSLYLGGIIMAVLSAHLMQHTLFQKEPAPLVMELPPYRLPNLKNMTHATALRVWLFVKKAGTVILLAMVFIWFLCYLPPGAAYASRESLMGRIGSLLAPLFVPCGFGNWESAVALLFGLGAKEIVVGTFGAVFGAEQEALVQSIRNHFTPASGLSFAVFTLFYMPCLPAIIALRREVGWRWAAFSVTWGLFLAWSLSAIVYHLASFLL